MLKNIFIKKDPHSIEYVFNELEAVFMSTKKNVNSKEALVKAILEFVEYIADRLERQRNKISKQVGVVTMRNNKINSDLLLIDNFNCIIEERLASNLNISKALIGISLYPLEKIVDLTNEQIVEKYESILNKEGVSKILNIIDTYLEQYNKH